MRPSWDEYFMDIAQMVATRSTCNRGSDLKFLPGRKGVGAVIVRNRIILCTGYNGSIRGAPHCDDVGHMMEGGHCVRTIHAELNAVVQAARNGINIDGATMYITASTCWTCFKMAANAGIKRIVFGQFYRDERIFEVAKKIGIELVDFSKISSQRKIFDKVGTQNEEKNPTLQVQHNSSEQDEEIKLDKPEDSVKLRW